MADKFHLITAILLSIVSLVTLIKWGITGDSGTLGIGIAMGAWARFAWQDFMNGEEENK